MPSLVLRPFLRFLASPSPYPSAGPPSPRRFSVSWNGSWVFHVLPGTGGGFSKFSIHSRYNARDVLSRCRFRDQEGPPCSAFAVHSLSHNCCEVESISQSRMQPVQCSAGGEDPLAEEEWEGLEKWGKGGGVVHKLAKIDASVIVEVGAVIYSRAIIGANTRISSGAIVGSHVVIGSHTKIGFNVVLQNCCVGNSTILHNGVCVGQDGFGFTVNSEGEMVKKPQKLKVQIGNNVEIGANSCIDRGRVAIGNLQVDARSWRDTVIGDHTKIDNLVQIGHNVVIGRCCMLCGQVGVAGSATLGDYVVMGGKSGVADHVSVASKVRIAAKSAVTSNIVEPGDYAGFPAVPAKEWRLSVVKFRKLGKQ